MYCKCFLSNKKCLIQIICQTIINDLKLLQIDTAIKLLLVTENIHFSAAAHWVIFKEENSIINMSTKIKDKQENGVND